MSINFMCTWQKNCTSWYTPWIVSKCDGWHRWLAVLCFNALLVMLRRSGHQFYSTVVQIHAWKKWILHFQTEYTPGLQCIIIIMYTKVWPSCHEGQFAHVWSYLLTYLLICMNMYTHGYTTVTSIMIKQWIS